MNLLVIALYLTAVLALGWLCRRGSHTADGHFLAGRAMGTLPIGISIMVTSFSAINYIAIPEEIGAHGLYVVASFPVFFLAAYPIARWWMPFFHRLNCTTAYQFLEQRYDRRVRTLAALLFLLWRLVWMAVALFISGKMLAAITHQNPLLMTAVCGLVATLYATIGGMRAIMWTDVLQAAVIALGFLILIPLLASSLPLPLLDTLRDSGRLRPLLPPDPQFLSPDPTIRITLWSALLGTLTAFMARYGADQVVMQRYFTAKSLRDAQRGIWLNAAISVLTLTLLAVLALLLHAWAINQQAIAPNAPTPKGFALQQLARLLAQLPPGLPGLIAAGILAATMSSIDSGINACAATIATDLQRHAARPPRAQLITLSIGLLVTLVACLAIPPLHQHNSIFAIINKLVNGLGSPLLAIILLARFSSPRLTSPTGILVGATLGLLASCAISLLVHPLALHYYAVANLVVTLLACLAASACLPTQNRR